MAIETGVRNFFGSKPPTPNGEIPAAVEFFTIVQFNPGPSVTHNRVWGARQVRSYAKLGSARGVRTQMQDTWVRCEGTPYTYFRILRTWIDGDGTVKVEWVD